MKKLFKILIPLFVLGALAYQFRSVLSVQFLSLGNNLYGLFVKAPCTKPIPYTLGTFDNGFNISKSYFQSALTDAEAIWEKSIDLELFVYASMDTTSDVLKINLIYDYRQQATSKLASLGIIVKDNRASYDMLKAKFTALKMEYEKEKGIFNMQINAFNQRKLAYEDEVNSLNKKNRVSQQEYDKVEADRLALNADSKELQNIQDHINNMVEEINALVVVLNRLVATLNLSVDKYNTVNTTRGESFEEGVYTSDGRSREIDIYEFSSREKLVRVLVHELGHALNLEHVDDPKAIMYKLNQGDNLTLTKADIEELKIKCGVK